MGQCYVAVNCYALEKKSCLNSRWQINILLSFPFFPLAVTLKILQSKELTLIPLLEEANCLRNSNKNKKLIKTVRVRWVEKGKFFKIHKVFCIINQHQYSHSSSKSNGYGNESPIVKESNNFKQGFLDIEKVSTNFCG
jgi:hypothetical protein